jgi:carboxylate-amine ligase
MAHRFTIGIEEEYQLVDRRTGELASRILGVLAKGEPVFEEQIKPELLQSMVEIVSPILSDIVAARQELYTTRALLSHMLQQEGLALISAGTHPTAAWQAQKRTPHERYIEMESEYQHIARSTLIFGLHVHIAIASQEQSIKIMNQVRTWLPHILALSSNSPFWSGTQTGIKSYRSVVWKRFPRSGMPDIYQSWDHFDGFVQDLVACGCIDNAKKIWWDIRPHPFFHTIEFRICDMPATVEDSLAIVALCQALVAKLTWLDDHGKEVPIFSRDCLDENKWRAMRYGLDAEIVDFTQKRTIPMRDAILELLDFVDEVVDDLGSRREMNYLRSLLSDSQGTGADRQIAVYRDSGGDVQQVIRFLVKQTMQGVRVEDAALSDKFLRLKEPQGRWHAPPLPILP